MYLQPAAKEADVVGKRIQDIKIKIVDRVHRMEMAREAKRLLQVRKSSTYSDLAYIANDGYHMYVWLCGIYI